PTNIYTLSLHDALPISGIIERDIQAAKLLHCFLDEHLNFGGLRYVGLHKQALAADGTDQVDGFLSFHFAPAGHHDFGARLRKKRSEEHTSELQSRGHLV